MTASTVVRSMGWTQHPHVASLLDVLDEQQKEAGRRLRALREAHHLSQEELAHEAKVSTKTISRWENGHTDKRRGRELARVADALGVEVGEIEVDDAGFVRLSDRLEQMEARLARIEELLSEAAGVSPAERATAAAQKARQAARRQRADTPAETRPKRATGSS